MTKKSVLLIGGIDPTAKAGLLRDAEMCLRLDQPFQILPSALTAQNQTQFLKSHPIQKNFLETLWQSYDFSNIGAIKIGMLHDEDFLNFLEEKLSVFKNKIPVIWDPVFQSSSGGELFPKSKIDIALKKLLPLTNVITPNAVELCQILNIDFEESHNGKDLCRQWVETFGTKPALYLKGGHLKTRATDWLVTHDDRLEFTSEISKNPLRGSGCLFASAVACELADGQNLTNACQNAKSYLQEFF